MVKRLYLAMVYTFLYAPIVILVIWSFNQAAYSLLWHGATWHWYRVLFHDTSLMRVALHSLMLAATASTLACVLGTLASMCLFRYRFFGKKFIHALLFVMIVAPDIIVGVAMVILFRIWATPLGFTTLLISHTTFCMPFVAVIVFARLSGFNPFLLEAARDLGASESHIFTRVMLPLIWPALAASWILSFSLSFDDVIISYFVTGPDFNILPLTIFARLRVGVTPEINALCTVLLVITAFIIMLSHWVMRRKS